MPTNIDQNSDLTQFLRQEMITWLANKMKCAESDIDPNAFFTDYDLDSIAIAQMLNVIEAHTNQSLELYITKDFRTISELAKHVANTAMNNAPSISSANMKDELSFTDNHYTDIKLPDLIE